MKQIPPPNKAKGSVLCPRSQKSSISKVNIRPYDIFPANLFVPAKILKRPGECWSVQEHVVAWFAMLSGWKWKDVVAAVAIIQGINPNTPVRKQFQCKRYCNRYLTLDDRVYNPDKLTHYAGRILLIRIVTYLKLQGMYKFPPGIDLGF